MGKFDTLFKEPENTKVSTVDNTSESIAGAILKPSEAQNNTEPTSVEENNEKTVMDGIYGCEPLDVINLKDITLKFGNFTLFDKLNFRIPDFKGMGQFITIMGKSGSGKTQLSRIISGLTKPNEGEVLMYGKPYTDKTFVPTVFQQYSSFEWMSVLENVMLPMKMKGIDKKVAKEKALELIDLVGLKGHEDKWAKMPPLSGGQLQRVALARSLASDSQILVLDEYSSGLDIASKAAMQDILLKIFYDQKIDRTFIMITHDISEALFLSQKIYIMDETHTFSDIIDIDYGVARRTRDIVKSEKYAEYYKRIEETFKNEALR